MTVENITKVIYDAIDDKLGKDIAILNIGAVSSLCDYFVIATASSQRQVKAIADNVEDELTKDVDFGVIESSKVASELFAPFSGEVVEANDEKLEYEPEYVNEAPYDAWICKIKVADMAEYEALLTAEQYEASLAE